MFAFALPQSRTCEEVGSLWGRWSHAEQGGKGRWGPEWCRCAVSTVGMWGQVQSGFQGETGMQLRKFPGAVGLLLGTGLQPRVFPQPRNVLMEDSGSPWGLLGVSAMTLGLAEGMPVD